MDKQYLINILTYWYQIEFFNCIDLKDLRNNKGGIIHYGGDVLIDDPNCLPWQNRENISRAGDGYFPNLQYSYTLYLGVFKNSEFFEQVKTYFGDKEDVDWSERRVDGGLTCAATIKVSKDGVLLLDTMELSTAPWALGQALKGNIDNIRFDDFERESEQLLHKLQSLEKLASNLKQNAGITAALSTFEIIEILKMLSDWAGFDPTQSDVAVIVKLNKLDCGRSQPKNMLITPDAIMMLQQLLNALTVYEEENSGDCIERGDDAKSNNHKEDEDKTSILNSFFLRDLERARELIQQDKLDESSPLVKYLSAIKLRHPDLLGPAGEKTVRQNVALDKTPLGRWPSDSTHSMSLMQQFAINTIDQEIDDHGVYSVNGPPGTGKTTMLRDLVANNIVNRARVLSHLDHSRSAFSGEASVKIGDKVHWGVKQLIPDLVGYEMIVVSNNNSAVENISKELPQSKAVGDEFSDIDYLKAVAQKLAAKHDDKKNIYALNQNDDCWGLVAASLGNYSNRKSFGKKIQFSKIESLTAVGEVAEKYSTLVPAIKSIMENSGDVEHHFKEAQREFTKAENLVKECINELICLEAVANAEKQRDVLKNKVTRLKEKMLNTELALSKIKLKKVPILSIRKWCVRKSLVKVFKLRLRHKVIEIKRFEAKCSRLDISIQQDKEKYKSLAEKHIDAAFGCHVTDLADAKTQRKAFCHSKALNKVRSELTIKAFDLHQAWLVASYNKCFSKNVNIFNELVMGNIKDYEHAKIVWQSLFMVIPVVSSAFASVANQFSKLRDGDVGWLFIDEAGQATPQQAVGAIMRSRRVIVVGDPLQVEPVFTIPPEFVEYLGRKLLGDNWNKWSPTVASVQTVADEVNPYGTNLISDEYWLGSPLRVHRRCKDPMFSIANEIAYNGTMIHGSDDVIEVGDFVWGDSCWFDVSGDVQGKHYVEEQGEFVLRLLYQHLDYYNKLPDCYIISPFKDVKFQLLYFLNRHFTYPNVEKSAFNDWLHGRVGTVHTFQGKEERIVLFVLGGSIEAQKSVNWASSKPNLLNVAVTRAKNRVFFVGCMQAWGASGYFSSASSLLPSRTDDHKVGLT